jgi:surface protein
MATLIASAKLTNAFRIRVVDKNVSANLTATFTIGHLTTYNFDPLVMDLPVLSGALARRTRRTYSDLESTSSLANTMRYATKGGKGVFAVTSSLVCEFPTYIEIDIEALMLQGLPEGTDCVLNFQEGWMLEDRGRRLPSGAFEYGSNTQDAPSPEFPSFVTFRTPKFFRSAFNAVFSIPTRTVLRIKQLQSAVASASTFSAVAIFNPGKFAALFAGVSQTVTVARKTVRGASALSSIVTTVVNNTRLKFAQSAVSSQFTMPPIDFWYRRLGVSVMSATATISAAVIRNIGPIIAYLDAAGTEQGFAFTSTANRTARITKNLSSTVSLSASPIATKGILSLPMSMTASLSVIADVPMILTTSGTTVSLPLWYGSINAVIDWGDGTTQTVTSTPNAKTSLVKNYGTSGTRTIYIKGFIQHWGYATAAQFDANTATVAKGFGYEVQAFGAIGIQSLIAYSSNVGNNGFTPVSIPNTVTDISYFYYASTPANPERLQYWNTSNIQKMEGVFRLSQGDLSAIPITGWNTGSVTTMRRMFRNSGTTGTGANFNADISGWDVSNVQDFSEMFRDTSSFQRNLSSWDVSSGTNFAFMFSAYYGELYNWNLSSATSPAALEQMIYYGQLRQDLTSWCVPNIASRPANFADSASPNYTGGEPVWGTCPGPRPIITVTTNKTTFTEGETLTITVTASNVSTATLYWRVNQDFPSWLNPNSGEGSPNTNTGRIYPGDVNNQTQGTLTLSAGTATLNILIPQDTITESTNESFRVDITSTFNPPSPLNLGQFLLGATPTITISSNNT